MHKKTEIPLAAVQAQAVASAEAQANQEAIMPTPPIGYQPLISIRSMDGDPMETAIVVGYQIAETEVRDIYGPDGRIKYPGDDGYLDLQMARLTRQPLPAGWRIETRKTMMLYALIDGCPILLEEHARDRGYPRALAIAPKWLQLGEVTC